MSTVNKFLIKLDESNYNGKVSVSEAGVEQIAIKLYEDVLEGRSGAIAVAEMLKFVGEVETKVKAMSDVNDQNKFVDLVRDEIKRNSDNGKSCTSKYGTKLELAETGTKYNFTVCGDPEWNYYTAEAAKIKKKIEQREAFLKMLTNPYPVGNVIDPGTGEVHEDVELNPPIKTSSSSFKQTLLKS